MLDINNKATVIEVVNSIETTLRENYTDSGNIDYFCNKSIWANSLKYIRYDDNDYFIKLRDIIFYSGFKAKIVEEKMDTINEHFPDLITVSNYTKTEIQKIISDEKMIKNKRKIEAIISNAKTMIQIINKYKSFFEYINKYDADKSQDKLFKLKEELVSKFKYLGKITVYHFLSDIGLNVLKPDSVITRIFTRLGLIKNRKQIWEAVEIGIEISKIVNKPIRYIDTLFVLYGQERPEAVCFEKNPRCEERCKIKKYCDYSK